MTARYPITAWVVVDMRYGKPGKRHVESVCVVDKLGIPTDQKPLELLGWKVVQLRGVYEDAGEGLSDGQLDEALSQLTEHQRQLDVDGVQVGVSRQALEIVLSTLDTYQNVLLRIAGRHDGLPELVPHLSDVEMYELAKDVLS